MRTEICQLALFVQDNAPYHTLKPVKTFLSEKDATVMEEPAHWPDMNPIDTVSKLINERAREKNPRNDEELWTNLKGEWEKISVDECKTLIHSYNKRCQVVIERKDQHIKY